MKRIIYKSAKFLLWIFLIYLGFSGMANGVSKCDVATGIEYKKCLGV
jgi:hypothetical protein